jgi:hypothetical protein
MRVGVVGASVLLVAIVAGCGSDCGGTSQSKLGITETTIAINQSFTASYQETGSCGGTFADAPEKTKWRTADTAFVTLDSVTGRVIGRRVGDARITPTATVTTGPTSILVHVTPRVSDASPVLRHRRWLTLNLPPSLRPWSAGLYISSANAGGRTNVPAVVARAM